MWQHHTTGAPVSLAMSTMPALGAAQWAAVARPAADAVVDPLGDGEEPRVPVDHQPPSVDAEPHAGRYQSAQHLGDAAGLGGVDVPDGATEEALAGGIGQQG